MTKPFIGVAGQSEENKPESVGEVIGIDKRHDSVCLSLLLLPEESEEPAQIWDWRIGERVKVMGNERT